MSRRLALLALAAGLALAAAQAANSLSNFTDPAGDSSGAPDITAVSADNDTTTGTITITVTTNQPTLAADADLLMGIDSDSNASTGPAGLDFLFDLDATGYFFGMWNGSTFVAAPNTTVHVFYSAGVARFVVNKSELGNTAAFNFFAEALQLSGDNIVAKDNAPDSGLYSYTLATPPPPPPPPPPPIVALGIPLAKAPGIHAGKAFSISDRVTTDAGSVKVTCTAHIGTRIVRAVGHYLNGTASCTGLVPKGTARKRLTGTITASISSGKKTKTFGFLIRA